MATTLLSTVQKPLVQIQFTESVMRWKATMVGASVKQQIKSAVPDLYYRLRRKRENGTSSYSGLMQWYTREVYANHERDVLEDVLLAFRDVFVAFV